MMKRIMALLVLALLAIPSVSAENFAVGSSFAIVGTCINESYLQKYMHLNVSGDIIHSDQDPIYCPFGCVANASQYGDDCQYTPQGKQDTGYQLALIVGLAAITFILAYITFNLDKQAHGSLQIFFFGLTYWFIFATVSSIQIILEMSFVTQMFPLITVIVAAIMWGGIFFMFYIIIFLIRSMFGWIKIRKKEKQEDPFGHNRRGL